MSAGKSFEGTCFHPTDPLTVFFIYYSSEESRSYIYKMDFDYLLGNYATRSNETNILQLVSVVAGGGTNFTGGQPTDCHYIPASDSIVFFMYSMQIVRQPLGGTSVVSKDAVTLASTSGLVSTPSNTFLQVTGFAPGVHFATDLLNNSFFKVNYKEILLKVTATGASIFYPPSVDAQLGSTFGSLTWSPKGSATSYRVNVNGVPKATTSTASATIAGLVPESMIAIAVLRRAALRTRRAWSKT